MPKPVPIDPAASPRWALSGRIVTMDAKATVIPRGTVWVKDAVIAAITEAGDAPPAGFDGVTPIPTQGTIFPGLIELHNHTAYNALPLWHVPKRYENRDTWGNTPEYHKLVTAPMKTIGEDTALLPALVRYVEIKALLGGVTTTQGTALFSAPGIRRYYRGIVRNVEQTGDPLLPEAGSRIGDAEASQAAAFLAEIERRDCFLLHLSEGTDAAAHSHFEALHMADGEWAIAPSLAGIHCVALLAADFQTLAQRGASMVWSPFSNLLLYGHTADVAAAKAAGAKASPLKIGLGSDWSPSGSKSLFGELKVARVYSQNNGPATGQPLAGDEELVRMASANGAEILRWEKQLGSIENEKRADLLVVAGQDDHNPYLPIFQGDERSVLLVSIDGTPRYGVRAMMSAEGPKTEKIRVGGEERVLYLAQETEDPDVAALSFAEAEAKLKDALANIKDIRLEQEHKAAPKLLADAPALHAHHPRLALDEFEHTALTQRPHLPLAGTATGPKDHPAAHAEPISSLLAPIELDPPSVADDAGFLDRVAAQVNLPEYIAPGLLELYGA
jgi:cytosine/adenosine deaminase-related metal-dependent hydrolase